jgi:hypothetical protein
MFKLYPRSDILDALRSGVEPYVVVNRIEVWLTRQGFVLSGMPTAISGDGTIYVDTTTDPSTVWNTFVPNISTPTEDVDLANRLTVVKSWRTKLQAGTSLTVVETRQFQLTILNDYLARLGE